MGHRSALHSIARRFLDTLTRLHYTAAIQYRTSMQKNWRVSVCKNGYEHHCTVSASGVALILAETFEAYMRWEAYWHE